MRLNRTIWTLDVNGALELKSYPAKTRYEVYMIPPVGNGRHVLKTDSKSKLRMWMNLNNLDFQRRPCLIAPYFNRRIYYAHFVLEEKRSEETKQE